MSLRRTASLLTSLGLAAGVATVVSVTGASADSTSQPLPFSQDWTNTELITVNDSWDGVPGVIGYRGDGLTGATGVDPQTVLGEGTPVVDVNANQTNPNTFGTGGVSEFHLADPVVALQGSGTARAPHLVLHLDTTGASNIEVSYNLRDIDGSADNSVQPVALQYRVGATSDFTNLPAGFVADASTGPSLATLVTPVSVTLPPAAENQPLVQLRIITTDAAGSDEWIGVDDIVVAVGDGPVPNCPATVITDAGVPTSATVSATDPNSLIASVTVVSPPVAGISLGAPSDGSAELLVAADTDPGTYDVVVQFATDDEPPQTATCTIRVIVVLETLVSVVQGTGSSSPFVGTTVRVDGIVTSPFTIADALGGFFLQEDNDDGDPETSEGVFVLCGDLCADAAVRDLVQVTGTVVETFGMTQITANAAPGEVAVLSTGHDLPAASIAPIPGSGPTNSGATFEPVEGMVVTIPGELAVSEYFQLARFGQLVLTAESRPHQFTHVAPPSVDGNQEYLADLATRRIILDDDNDDDNDAITLPPDEPYPYPSGGLENTNKFRGGDTIDDLTGVMHWSFGAWRIRPIPTLDYVFAPVNPFPAVPDDVGSDLTVAAYNVLNYFTTIDTTSSNNVGDCGPSGTLDCRGADSEAELARQLDKIVAALSTMDTDVVGLIEIQNDGEDQSVASIVDALNALGGPQYDYIATGFIGTDAIKVALIYQPASVSPVGDYTILDSSVDPTFIDTLNRPVLIQTFEENDTGERFTVAVNHLKSKGSACAGDPDLLDGAGNCNVTRTNAAQALASYLAGDPTESGDPDFLIIGDLNSYRMEDPITLLKAAGYTDLIEEFLGDEAYSFVFDGQLGYLDHALATASLTSQVTGVTEWHTNADEVPLFDYNDTVRDAGESSFERESDALPLYEPNAVRASDHDPVIVGLCLDTEPPEIDISLSHDVLWPPLHQYVTVTADVTATDNCDPDPQIDLVSVTSNEPDDGVDDGSTINDIVIDGDFSFRLRAERSGVGTGRVYTVTYMATDASGNVSIGTATVSVPLSRGR